jgi:cell division protein FtsX
MPSRRGRRQWLSGVSHAPVALLVLLAGCTSVVSGTAHSKADLPSTSYDVTVYLCATDVAGDRCRRATTRAQTAAVRTQLLADPATSNVLYLSERDQVHVASYVLPKDQLQYIQIGDLPASFLVSLTDPQGADAFHARYIRLAGVSRVIPCSKNRCSVDLLHRAGVVH